MPDDLEERLKSHARAFDGLLSLIPAKIYYGEDNSDQWLRKKQTKEEKRTAKIAKLDPDNVKSAKDIMDERAAAIATTKRKRGPTDESGIDDLDNGAERPREGLKKVSQEAKKQKTQKGTARSSKQHPTPEASSMTIEEQTRRRKAENKALKKQRKQEKSEKSKAKRERQKARKAGLASDEDQEVNHDEESIDGQSDMEDNEMPGMIDIQPQACETQIASPSTASSPTEVELHSPPFHSTSSSISSIQPPTTSEATMKTVSTMPASDTIPTKASPEELRTRLQIRIEELRSARKADGPDGKPARSRQELLEARRKKEEQRKAHKKELRRKAKEEEARKQDEDIARRFSPGGSGSLLGSPRSPLTDSNAFSFGRVAFGDGSQANATLSTLLSQTTKRKSGPSDPAALLRAAESKASRLASLDPAKRETIEQQDMWLKARKKAHGDRIKDDTSLLKRALKRQDSKKGKSEKEWKARNEGVQKGIAQRQRKREENLKKRKEGSGKQKPTKRPGFEGSFRAKHGAKK